MRDTVKIFYVYELRDPDGVVFYVGKGTKNRINMHKTPSAMRGKTHLYCKLRNFKSRGVKYTSEKVFETEVESDAFKEEIRLIALYGRDNLCNHTDGGEGPSGHIPSAETLAKRGASIKKNWEVTREFRIASMQGWKKTLEQREAISYRMKNCPPARIAKFRAAAPKKGHKVSPETLLKMKEANRKNRDKRRILSSVAAKKRVENNTPNWQKFRDAGLNPTEETRKKLGRKGRKMSVESRQKMSESRKGKVFSLETREKISKAHKGKPKVRKKHFHSNGEVYTAHQLAEMLNTSVRNVNSRLRNGWTVEQVLSAPVYPRPNRSLNMRAKFAVNRFNELVTRSSPKRVIALADDKRPAVVSSIAAMPDIAADDEPSFE